MGSRGGDGGAPGWPRWPTTWSDTSRSAHGGRGTALTVPLLEQDLSIPSGGTPVLIVLDRRLVQLILTLGCAYLAGVLTVLVLLRA